RRYQRRMVSGPTTYATPSRLGQSRVIPTNSESQRIQRDGTGRESWLKLAIGPCIKVSMLTYKRNQVEAAISRLLRPGSKEPTLELRVRLKRLLETDRAHGRVARSTDPTRANYAFYSADAPGSGGDVWFSGYEAFALLIGIRLMGHGWPQGSAVSVMRLVR